MREPIALWPTAVCADIDQEEPTLTPMLLEQGESKALVIVLPGGGYANLAPHEAEPIAEHFNRHGMHAAVLRYRRAPNRHPAPIHDAQRGIRMVRELASTWGIENLRVGILGFSAGGHLASTATVHYDRFTSEEDDLAGKHSARPDASALCYAVIDMSGPFTHVGSRNNLLGDAADDEMKELMTSFDHVNKSTPATFLWHTIQDGAVPVENSMQFATACRKHGVPFELHAYELGNHGVGLATNDMNGVDTWANLCAYFFRRHLIDAASQ